MTKKDKWIIRWKVENSAGDGYWTVAIDKKGNYGCSCPVWKFKRKECKHIKYVKENPNTETNKTEIKHPDLIPANVLRPTLNKDKNQILYPLVPLNGNFVWMEATICYFLMEQEFSWSEVKQHRKHLPTTWTKKAVYEYIGENGMAEYKNYGPMCNTLVRQVN